MDYSAIIDHLDGIDVCFYCLGVYTGQVPKNEFRKITVDYTEAFAKILQERSPAASFCFLSGQGADQTERSRITFAREKGKAENILRGQSFANLYIFKPGYIFPSTPRKELNFSYKIMRISYKSLLSKIYPNFGVTSDRHAFVMVNTGLTGSDRIIFENADIRMYRVKTFSIIALDKIT